MAQIFGGYVACLLIYAQYRDLIKVQITCVQYPAGLTAIQAAEASLESKGIYDSLMFTPTGPAGILGLYLPVGSNISRVLLNEFVVVRQLVLNVSDV
jgi:hypothetical protein